MNKFLKIFIIGGCLVFLQASLKAQNLTELVEIPTAEIYPSSTYNVNLRVYDSGSILTRLLFSVKFFQLGAYIDTENATGQDTAKMRDVKPLLKIQLYSGGQVFPAIAIGYDGQGHGTYFKEGQFDQVRKEIVAKARYGELERGFYLVFSKELFFPGLELHFGGSNKDYSYGFAGASFKFEEQGSVFVEYDRIRNLGDITNNRCNAGLKFNISPELGIEFDFKNIGNRGEKYERMMKFDYSGSF